MQDAPISEPDARNLRFLRILVTVLTATMILGLLTIVALLVIRFSGERPAAVIIPDEISLPVGAKAKAITKGSDWYAVVTDGDEILIFDGISHNLRQTIQILAAPDQTN